MMNPQAQTYSKFVKANDFEGVLEYKYFVHMRDEDGKSKLQGITGHTKEHLNLHKENMKKRHEAELKSLEDVFAILEGKDKKKLEDAKPAPSLELVKEENKEAPKVEEKPAEVKEEIKQ